MTDDGGESPARLLLLPALAGAALIAGAVLFSYYPALHGGFLLDDDLLLTQSPLIKAADGLFRFWCTSEPSDYWPVTNTTFWLEWRLWGMNTTGYHATNLALHVLDALLIWTLLRRLAIPGAFLAAFVFAVHPVNVESVAWIAQRKNLLALSFFLASILAYLKARRPGGAVWYWASLLAFTLAMLSKGSVAILPLVLLGLSGWGQGRRGLNKAELLRTAPFFAVAAVLTAVNVWFQTHGSGAPVRTSSLTERVLGAGAVVWFYLGKALVPVGLVFIYPQWNVRAADPRWWLPLLATLAVTAALLLWHEGRWERRLLFAWAFFGIALLPVMGFTDVGFMRYSLVADRYQHIAILGVIVFVVAAGWALYERARGAARSMIAAAAVVAVVVLVFLTRGQSRLYRDAVVLYEATLAKNPGAWIAHNNLGAMLNERGQSELAKSHFEEALRLHPDYPDAHSNLGTVLERLGRMEEARAQFLEALRLRADHAEANGHVGTALAGAGRFETAIAHFERAVQATPDDAVAQTNLGNVLVALERWREAVPPLERAARLRPESPEIRGNLGIALLSSDRAEEAIAQLEQALRLRPDYAQARVHLAMAFGQVGRRPEAIDTARKALPLAEATGDVVLVQRLRTWLASYEAAPPGDRPRR